MSYDLMVFNPKSPPSDRKGFINWYDNQTTWSESNNYNDPDVTTPELRAWFMEMINQYPAMNGPFATDDIDNPKMSDYSVGKSIIYVAFAWSQAESARQTMFDLAKKHNIGFFDVSTSNGAVWMPDQKGEYICMHGGDDTQKKTRKWWKLGNKK